VTDQKREDKDSSAQDESTHFGYQSIPTSSKTTRVGQIFQSVAHRYDVMNDLMSFGLHRFWKRLAVARANVRPHHKILDLAGGTGDLTAGLAKYLNAEGQIILADINEAMLTKGRARLIDKGIFQSIQWVQANAEQLPFPDSYFDCITMAFGLRNVTYKDKALAEMVRVLKPGGRTIILEFSKPSNPLINTLYDTYSFSVLPYLGKIVCNDSESYQYLAESIRMHPDQEGLKKLMESAGFEKVDYQNIHGGIVAIHKGFKF
jgi:demethylmenaquinone methyltransferase/2-methoxy-6-polyprenyl-1,4-benzoquinol methylase